jgi:hypothetical protein
MSIKMDISQNDLNRISKNFRDLSDLKKRNVIKKFLVKAAKPIIEVAKNEAKTKIQNTETFTFKRKGTVYTIKPQTIMKSIGVINHNKSSVPMVSVGYRTKGTYDGWFAHFIDAGTKVRKSKRKGKAANRGQIEARNIMPKGENAIPTAKVIFEKEINKELTTIWK